MGFIWSLKPVPGQRDGIRLVKRDVTKPQQIELLLVNDHIQIVVYDGSIGHLLKETVYRWYMAKGVERKEVKLTRLYGTIFLPEGRFLCISISIYA